MNLLAQVQQRFREGLTGFVVNADKMPDYLAMIKPAQEAKFGDYQANMAMSLQKEMGQKPRDIAQQIIDRLVVGDMFEPPEIAGPGFINLRFRVDWLGRQIQAMAADERLGVDGVEKVKTYVIDYSSPNVAKPLHVGHLRSTIIGDALKRILQFLGHRVIADNHLGDWGTQFGMLIFGYKNFVDREALQRDPVREMVRLYQHVRGLTRGAEDEEGEVTLTAQEQAVMEQCRIETSKLQAGDPENLELWKQFMPWCMGAIEPIYEQLDVRFDHQYGESFFNPLMPAVVEDVLAKGIARLSRGAVAIFLEGTPDPVPDDKKGDVRFSPVIVRKGDGAFTYMASDLATIRFRMTEWMPDAILYVVGIPQKFHFERLFDAARRWGYREVELQHVMFGSVLGADKRVLSTRNGGAAELSELLEMAVARGAEKYAAICQERRERGEEVPELSPAEQEAIARRVGIGAVKYADLCQNRLSDYVFDWKKMLATDGNSATYMQYAYTRCQGIFRKGEVDPASLRISPLAPALAAPQERALALQLLQFGETVHAAAADYAPHLLTAYLWELARAYSRFFEGCPVLRAETLELKQARLTLCDLTARVIRQTLALLGIDTMDRM